MSTTKRTAQLSTAELGQRYRAARCAIERSRLQIIWLLSQGRSAREVAAVTGYGQRWITVIVQRYNAKGATGLGDQRARNVGARRLLAQEDEVALRDALAEPPTDGGLWSGPKVAAWMTARLGRKVWPQRGWGLPEEARVQPPRATAETCQGGERRGAGCLHKKLARRVSGRHAGNPKRPIEVWAFDEHRVGLKPLSRRQWAPVGQRPMAPGQHRFEWLSVYGFVHPSTGEVVWFLCNGVSTVLLSAVLAAFAAAVGAGQDKRVVLVLDNAGWHASDKLVVPDGVILEFLPPYSPELPAERLSGR